ncbi:MAG: ACT domain-containing protein [Oscillospiraceae bacterium]|nr:ACT domain-containing protein [Oscillospiraceae bacterium]
MLIKQISVFLENRKGKLVEITDILAKNNINIRALSLADTADYGVLRMIVNDTVKAEKVLRENKIIVSINSMVSVSLPDEPGGLSKVLHVLADNDLQIEYTYAFISHDAEKAFVLMRIEEDLKACDILIKNGFEGLEEIN